MVALTGDGAYPTANYTGNYNDLANQEKDPVGRVACSWKAMTLQETPLMAVPTVSSMMK